MAASASNQDHTMVEISDESCGDSDNFEILESWSPGSDTLRVQNSSSPEKQPLPLFLSKTNSERYIPVELQPVSKVALPRRGSTDSMVENVNQISISNDGQRRLEKVDNASSSISGTPQLQQAKETDIAQGINNSHVASNTLPSDERDHRGRSGDTEIMVLQDTEDIKPDVVMLQKESGMQGENCRKFFFEMIKQLYNFNTAFIVNKVNYSRTSIVLNAPDFQLFFELFEFRTYRVGFFHIVGKI